MATQFGTAAPFGLTTQTGIITDATSWNYSQDKKVIADADGDAVAKAYFNERIEGTIGGYIPTNTPFSGTLAASLTLSEAPNDYLKCSVGTLSIVESVSVTKTNEDYVRIEVAFENHSGITA